MIRPACAFLSLYLCIYVITLLFWGTTFAKYCGQTWNKFIWNKTTGLLYMAVENQLLGHKSGTEHYDKEGWWLESDRNWFFALCTFFFCENHLVCNILSQYCSTVLLVQVTEFYIVKNSSYNNSKVFAERSYYIQYCRIPN